MLSRSSIDDSRKERNSPLFTRSADELPHPALDRRVERGDRDLLLAVAPGARRGPGRAAGSGHAKSKKEREEVFRERERVTRPTFFFLPLSFETSVGSTSLLSCQFDPLSLSPSLSTL